MRVAYLTTQLRHSHIPLKKRCDVRSFPIGPPHSKTWMVDARHQTVRDRSRARCRPARKRQRPPERAREHGVGPPVLKAARERQRAPESARERQRAPESARERQRAPESARARPRALASQVKPAKRKKTSRRKCRGSRDQCGLARASLDAKCVARYDRHAPTTVAKAQRHRHKECQGC